MTDKNKKIISLAYGIILSVMLAVSGILLIYSCVSIYNLGDRPFTPESIGTAFSKISIPIYATIALVAIGIIGKLLEPHKKDAPRANVSKKAVAKRLEEKLDITLLSGETAKAIANAKKKIKMTRIVLTAISAIALIPALVYALIPSSFSMEYNESVIRACLIILPCILVSAASLVILSYFDNANYDKLVAQLKLAIASGAKKDKSDTEVDTNSKVASRIMLAVRVAILAISVVFIIDGITNGGFSDVLIKAINICTECIGLG